MVWNHRSTRCAVIDESARLNRLPAEHDLFARLYVCKGSTAERTSRCMKVDVVLEEIAIRILQREFYVVTLVADDQRPWD